MNCEEVPQREGNKDCLTPHINSKHSSLLLIPHAAAANAKLEQLNYKPLTFILGSSNVIVPQ